MAVTAKLGAGTKLSITTDGGTTYTQVFGIKGLGATGQTKPEADVTPLEATSKEYIAGINEGESKTISMFWDEGDAGQAALKAAEVAGDVVGIKIEFPNTKVATFDMVLLGWLVDEPSNTDAMVATVSGRMTGDVTWA